MSNIMSGSKKDITIYYILPYDGEIRHGIQQPGVAQAIGLSVSPKGS